MNEGILGTSHAVENRGYSPGGAQGGTREMSRTANFYGPDSLGLIGARSVLGGAQNWTSL